ncbi:MAG: alpha/beta hydrolase [Candidatus Heimdallarchaeaceae archaeon]
MNSKKTADKSKVGFLLIHGFTGTHFEMALLEEFLVNKGFTVNNITLPGHETSIEDLNTKTYDELISSPQKE